MDILETIGELGHERVLVCSNRDAGLRAIIAVHSTQLGPGLGGVRMWPYASTEEALTDVLRLSRGMTYKAAAAGVQLGGAKAVILVDPKRDKSEVLFRAFGRCVGPVEQQDSGLRRPQQVLHALGRGLPTLAAEPPSRASGVHPLAVANR